MQTKRRIALKGFGVAALILALMGSFAGSTAAQTLCADEPLLGVVDGDGDGVASTGEIRAVAPNNAELQAAADRLEGAGYAGIAYADCSGGADAGGASAADGSGGSTDGTGTDSSGGASTGEAAIATGDSGSAGAGNAGVAGNGAGQPGQIAGADGTVVNALPSTGDGAAAVLGPVGMAGMLAALALIAFALAIACRRERVLGR